MNYVISITGPEALGVLEDICEELALPLNVTLHGRGTAVQSMLDLLGIESNEKRVVLSTATEEKTAALIEAEAAAAHRRTGSRHRDRRAGQKHWRRENRGISDG